MTLTVSQRLVARDELCRDCQACTLGCSLYHEGACGLGLEETIPEVEARRRTHK